MACYQRPRAAARRAPFRPRPRRRARRGGDRRDRPALDSRRQPCQSGGPILTATIRAILPDDLDFAAACTAAEGWASETREIFAGFLRREPGGCFVAEADGQRAGICVATSYGDAGFIGEVVVRREVRVAGLGRALLAAALDYLRGRRVHSVYLDAVARAVPFYESVGFRVVCRSLRFLGQVEPTAWSRDTGRAGRAEAAAVAACVRPLREPDLPAVLALDREVFGADRGFFLERRLSLWPQYAWALEREGGLAGFVLGLQGRGLVAAGPLVLAEELPAAPDGAASHASPLALLAALSGAAGGAPLRIGVLESNGEAASALRAVPGLQAQRASWRMVHGPGVGLGEAPRCWAVGSAAKG